MGLIEYSSQAWSKGLSELNFKNNYVLLFKVICLSEKNKNLQQKYEILNFILFQCYNYTRLIRILWHRIRRKEEEKQTWDNLFPSPSYYDHSRESSVDFGDDWLEFLVLLAVQRDALLAGVHVHRLLVRVVLADVDVSLALELTDLIGIIIYTFVLVLV